ncbi:MAG: TonB-dependent receptor [Litorimonas sp.]
MTKPSTLDRHLLLGVASFAMLMSAIPAHAQVVDEDVDLVEDEVVATGIRQSIEDALNIKRNAGGIVEAITAEDIGKLPDISIADSLARLPGVTAQRVRGRAQRVSIRGLGPDFSLALLNGREIVSASNNRGVEFDQFPSELIGQGIVYKTPQADLAATGLAGVVDLRTLKPLDYNETIFNASGRYVINDNGSLNPDFSDDGYRLFGSLVTQNDAKTVGLSVGITHETTPTQFFQRNLKVGSGQTNDFNGTFVPRDNPRSGVESREFERTSVAGTLQFEPTDDASITLDAFYSDFSDAGVFRGVETPLASWANVSQTPSFTGGPGVASSATYDSDSVAGIGIANFLRTDTEVNDVETLAFGINFKNRFNDRLTLELDAGHSTLSRTDIDYESYAGTAFNAFYNNEPSQVAPVTFTFDPDGEYSISTPLDYTSPNNVVLTTPGGWGGPDNAQVGFINQPDVDDELTQLEAELDYEIQVFNIIDSVTVGGRINRRDKTFLNQRAFLRTSSAFTNNEAAIPESAIVGATDSGSIGLDVIAYDPSSLLSDGIYRVELTGGGQEFQISEDINTLYAMINLGDASDRLFGNIGLQYVDVEQASTGLVGRLTTDQRISTTGEASYDDWLPTVNLGYRVTDEFQIRGAFGESVTRPRLDDLAASTGVGINPQVCEDLDGDGLPDTFDNSAFNPPSQLCLGGGGGNPFLRPYASTNYDASAEWFFSAAGALSVALFHKDLSDYIDNGSAIIDDAGFAGEILGSGFVSANPNASVFSIGGPVNGLDGSLTGFEVALSVPFDEVFDMPFAGFGFNGNFGYTDSSLERPVGNDFVDVSIPGFSEETANGEVYYENSGWQARVNVSYRSDYVTQIVSFDQSLLTPRAKSRTTVDAQLGYEFQSGPLEGLNLRVEAYNLTDEPFVTIEEQPDGSVFPSVREDYGRTFNFTVAKTF